MSISFGRMPAEWEAHDATWIAWPFLDDDFPGRIPAVESVYVEIIRNLLRSEAVVCLCESQATVARVEEMLAEHHIDTERLRLEVLPVNRTWLRDSAPTAIKSNEDNSTQWVAWQFNAWAKYENYEKDRNVPPLVSKVSGYPLLNARRLDTDEPFVLEGGAIETDGEGTLLVTEECLLSEVQQRNAGLGVAEYEAMFHRYLGITKTIWLGAGCLGDDTHGHIDDIARFVAPGKVVVAVPEKGHPQFETLDENRRRLSEAVDAKGRALEVTTLPMPEDIFYQGEQLPASYANFYIANTVVLVPTFNDPNDRLALEILAALFPERTVIGIHARELVIGQGTLHCLTQQQPR